jgi:cation diffusion facilitator CzcD-associated flavoprotein CzcO
MSEHHSIVVMGAGFGGIGLAIALRQAGFDDIVLLERAPDLGGTWQANTYPGCAASPRTSGCSPWAPAPAWSGLSP